MTDCIFCKIARGEIASSKVYEDDEILLSRQSIRRRRCIHGDTEEAHRFVADAGAADAPLLGRMLAMTGRSRANRDRPMVSARS
jgi:histidine triad (HIT) family protein